MKKLIAVLIAAVSLTGCGASATGKYKSVECVGAYKVKTFPFNETYPVKLNAVRENRFGEKSYRVAPGQKYVSFINRWQVKNKFELVECKNG